jgi:cytosine/creatinine deaminase
MNKFLKAAIEEARAGLATGGIPIGSVLVIENEIVGRGHNLRVQDGSPVLHAEIACLANAGRLRPSDYRRSVLYTTLSPCDMCSGAVLLYKIPVVVVGENRTFKGPEQYLRDRGVQLEVIDSTESYELMQNFISEQPELWCEDIGETNAGKG